MHMKKIVVVDDEPDITSSIKQILESTSDEYEVVSASSGMQCLELLKDNNVPDLIILDILMPEINGWDLFYKLQENPSWAKIPVIFLTARTDKAAEHTGHFLGAEFMSKPFDVEEFKRMIDKVFVGG